MKSTYHDIYAIVHRCILDMVRSLPRRDHPSAHARRMLAQSIAWICLDLRTGCLIDFCRIPTPQHTLPELISNLRKSCTACAPIFALVDPTTGDVFFVNARLLVQRFGSEAAGHEGLALDLLGSTTFILLDRPMRELQSQPELEAILSASGLPKLVMLRSVDPAPHVLVPLAGILLEYPIAYVPMSQPTTQDTSPYLSGHALNVFDISLRSGKTNDLLELMKFSCPAEFLVSESRSTRNLNALRQRLDMAVERLNSKIDGGDGPLWELVFTRSRVIVDRVAL